LAARLFELVVEVSPGFAEAASASLFAAGAAGLEQRSVRHRVELIAWSEQRAILESWRKSVERALGERGRPVIRVRPSAHADWQRRWVQGLAPVKLGPTLLVCPTSPGKRPRVLANRIAIVPRLTFGLGDHPTTRLAARAVERWASAAPGGKLLDVGCGTGILCFVGLLSGAARAVGIDSDGAAVENARENAALNGLGERATFRTQRASALRSKFDLAVSNIGLATLLELRPELVRLAPELVLTGVLDNEVERLEAAYRRSGFAVARTETCQGWAILTLARGPGRAARWAAPGKVARTRRARGP